jgi:hypothetical protein
MMGGALSSRASCQNPKSRITPHHASAQSAPPVAHNPVCFFTTCTAGAPGFLACDNAHDIIAGIWRNSLSHDGWAVDRHVPIPDHAHFFARPARDGKPLATRHQTWKSLTARNLMMAPRLQAPIWQPETFDHILRSAESCTAKWQ